MRTSQLQLQVIDQLNVDILVVTEPPLELLTHRDVVAAPVLRPGKHGLESWVAIVGPDLRPLQPVAPYQRMAVSAVLESFRQRVIVYGSVLPWRTAHTQPDLAVPGESFPVMFQRLLAEQERDIVDLQRAHSDAVVIWAGDFNQSLEGSEAVGSRSGRHRLESTLVRLGMQAWNRCSEHAVPGLRTIDLICGPATLLPHSIDRLEPVVDGRRVSDHAGYIVDIPGL